MLQLVSCTLHFYDARFSKNISFHAFRLMGTAIDLWVSVLSTRYAISGLFSQRVISEAFCKVQEIR